MELSVIEEGGDRVIEACFGPFETRDAARRWLDR
jgi:hypothetical protein